MDVWRFCVITPTWVTSDGSRPWAFDTRFCTSTAAMSGLNPCLKYTLIEADPLFAAVDFIYVMPSAPFIDSSRGAITELSTAWAFAPV